MADKVQGETPKKKVWKRMPAPPAIITVSRPVLTEEERARRMKIIHDAAADLLRIKFIREAEREREAALAAQKAEATASAGG